MKNSILFFSIFLFFSYGFTSYNNVSLDDKNNITSLNKVVTFVSTNYDIEGRTRILDTKRETSYHTFDLNSKTITMIIKHSNGKVEKNVFNYTSKKTITSLSGNESIEFYVKNSSCNLIWMDAINSIGYEFDNGQKYVFYGVQMI